MDQFIRIWQLRLIAPVPLRSLNAIRVNGLNTVAARMYVQVLAGLV